MRTTSLLSILIILSIFASGCGGSGGSKTIEQPEDHPYWTVLIFMAADNDLESYAIQDMNELEAIGSTPEVTVLVQLDRNPSYDTSNGNWSSTRRYYITKDFNTSTIGSQLLADLGERDMADPQELAEFIQWGIENYPSDHYLLVLWDHGSGWRYRTLESIPMAVKSINLDETDRSEMNINEIVQGLNQSQNVDVLVFDACLMGMIETAAAVKDHADFMVASEENVPATGLQYSNLLDSLTKTPSMESEEVATTIVDQYADYYLSLYSSGLTMSAINLSSVDSLVTGANQLSQSIINNLDSVSTYVQYVQTITQKYDQANGEYEDYKDLCDFANRLTTAPAQEVCTAAQSVISAMENAVVHERHSAGAMGNSHGLSVYIPVSGNTTLLNQYRTLDFAQSTTWDDFLAVY